MRALSRGFSRCPARSAAVRRVVRRAGDRLVGRPERLLGARVRVREQAFGGGGGLFGEPPVALGDEGGGILEERPEENSGPRDALLLIEGIQGVARRRRAREASRPVLGVQRPQKRVDGGGNRRVEKRGQIRLDLG